MRICPVCAGVSGTWIWMLAARFLGYPIDLLIFAILMGGSVVGIAYQVEKRLFIKSAEWQTPLLWKMLFIPAGFVLAYGVLTQWWNVVLVSFTFLLSLLFVFFASQRKIKDSGKTTKELEKKMKDCC